MFKVEGVNVGTKQMYMSKLHTFLLLPRTLGVSVADLQGDCLA